MKIVDLLRKESINLNGEVRSKKETIDQMVDLMAAGGNIADVDIYREGVYKREEEGTTGIGEGIAIPHAKTDAVKAPGLAAMVVKEGVDYDSLDGEPVHLIFLIAAPNTEDNVHLEVLSRLSMLLMDDGFRENLMSAGTKEEFLGYIDAAEKEKFPEESKEQKENDKEDKKGYQILAVTACPTGIAHTYMAAESLENKAKEMGYTIKVETNGSGGDKNVLTADEIAGCDCIIIAADKDVKMARFDGKPVIITKVANGISKSEELITEAMSGKAPIYRSKGTDEAALSQERGRPGKKDLQKPDERRIPYASIRDWRRHPDRPVLPGGQCQCGSRGLWIWDAACVVLPYGGQYCVWHDVPNPGRIYRDGNCGQAGADARHRGRITCQGGNIRIPAGRPVGIFRLLRSADCRFRCRLPDGAD